jgi:uncharacterized membrane protein YtjA (UPF0391 family)
MVRTSRPDSSDRLDHRLDQGRKRVQKGCAAAMLRFALAFLIIALVAAALQYLGVAAAMASVAKMIFFIFTLLFLFCLAGHIYRGS